MSDKKVPWIAVICGRCNRVLKTDKSRETGYGPICLKRIAEEQAGKQINIFEHLEPGN